MKNFLFYVMIIMTVAISSCSKTEMPDCSSFKEDASTTQYDSTRSNSNDKEMLQFDTEDDFQAAVAQLKDLSSGEEKSSWVRNNFGDFKSIQDLYWDAMNEVDEDNDDSIESFELFQEKYNGLYFPKYMEDMGYYIPMTDLDMAYLVNRNCEVSIAGKIKNLRDIHDYSILVMLGRAYYSMENPMAIGTVYDFTLRSTSMDPVGPEYDSGWKEFKDKATTDGTARKVKLKVRRKFVTIPISPITKGSQSRVHLELCFRKKRWCGYTNYNGQETMTFKTVIPGYGNLGPLVFNHESYSSHDDEFPYPIKISHDSNHYYYTFAEVPFNVTVNFNKIKDPIIFEWNMYALQYVTGPAGDPAPIFPQF